MLDESPFTAKDAKRLAGLSYRQLNDWEARGAITGERSSERSWRRFTPKQIFALMVCGEIRRLYGIPVEKLRYVRDLVLEDDERDHFLAAVSRMSMGLHVYLLTDLRKTFVMDSDLEFADLMDHGDFRVETTQPFIFLRLNTIVNRLLGALKEPIELKPHDQLYRVRAEAEAALSVSTKPELDLLQAARSGTFAKIVVELRDGVIRRIDAEGDTDPAELDHGADGVRMKRTADFETFEVNRRDGKVDRARRTLPGNYTKKDNEPIFFATRVRTRPDADGDET